MSFWLRTLAVLLSLWAAGVCEAAERAVHALESCSDDATAQACDDCSACDACALSDCGCCATRTFVASDGAPVLTGVPHELPLPLFTERIAVASATSDIFRPPRA